MQLKSSACFLSACIAVAALSAPAAEPVEFTQHRVGDFRSEACCVADFDNDGKLDISAGPFVYLAPDWRAWKIRDLKGEVDQQGNGYYWDFANMPMDVDGDGKVDIVSCDWFQKCIDWYRNILPEQGLWPRSLIDENGNYECASLVDIDGDGKALEVLAHVQETVWYDRIAGPDQQFSLTKRVVSNKPITFGGGAGDINGDGRPDILRPSAWYEAPADPRTGRWIEHPLAVGSQEEGKADHTPQVLVFDVDGDGHNDIITSSAHQYGIFWYQQIREGDRVTWKQHTIDDTWSQAHSLALADINSDGTPDLVTGKRFRAHNGNDPGADEPLGVYWYELDRATAPVWTRHVISFDNNVGSGLDIHVVDLDGDGDLDVVVTGKWGGPAWFENRLKSGR